MSNLWCSELWLHSIYLLFQPYPVQESCISYFYLDLRVVLWIWNWLHPNKPRQFQLHLTELFCFQSWNIYVFSVKWTNLFFELHEGLLPIDRMIYLSYETQSGRLLKTKSLMKYCYPQTRCWFLHWITSLYSYIYRGYCYIYIPLNLNHKEIQLYHSTFVSPENQYISVLYQK